MKAAKHTVRTSATSAIRVAPERNRQSAPRPLDATFTAGGAEPIDAPMWPRSAALWLQPEISPSIPVWTGLAIERHFGIPSPGFLCFETALSNRPATISLHDELRPPARMDVPQSGLATLGWDPRAVCRQQGRV